MDRNRKIILAILAFLALSAVLAIIDIGLTMQDTTGKGYAISAPGVGPGVGIVRINGLIQFGKGGDGSFGLQSGSEAVLQRIDNLQRDKRIKAIVVRINSPGGTVAATQEIFIKILKLRKKNIPIVASMGDIAASGGYYVASACNYIIANYGTLTGSIGVITVSPNLKGLFEKLGIQLNVIKSGKFKDILSSHRDIDIEEREMLQKMVDSLYKKFIKDVSLGRNIAIADIEPHADGRIFNGEGAKEAKLIDAVGTMEDAIAYARKEAKLPEDSAVYDDVVSPFERFFMTMESMVLKESRIESKLKINSYNMFEYRYLP